MSNRRRHTGNRDNPEPTKCLGIFGLSLYTQERDLREVFGRFGPLEDVQVVYDRQTGRSRGFAFIHFRNVEDSIEAKDRGPGMEIDGRRIRVDFSITTRAHTPTPGIYLGKPTASSYSRRRSPSPYTEEGAEGVVTAAGVATPDLGRGHALTALGEVIIEEVNRTVKINDQIWRCYCRLKEDNFCQKHHPT